MCSHPTRCAISQVHDYSFIRIIGAFCSFNHLLDHLHSRNNEAASNWCALICNRATERAERRGKKRREFERRRATRWWLVGSENTFWMKHYCWSSVIDSLMHFTLENGKPATSLSGPLVSLLTSGNAVRPSSKEQAIRRVSVRDDKNEMKYSFEETVTVDCASSLTDPVDCYIKRSSFNSSSSVLRNFFHSWSL